MNPSPAGLFARQIWVQPAQTSDSRPPACTPFRLHSGGEINIGGGTIITLTQDAAFQPACHGTPVPPPIDPLEAGADLSVLDSQDPWYSSPNPQIYAISAVTIVSYMLVIILFVTPRTFFVGGAGGGGGFLGQRGVISGAYGGNPVIGIGSRPWLQKLAALTVAISMTIVTADTLDAAHDQYEAGYQDASELTTMVVGSTEVRVSRVISETFLWLAQAQTLIRLFPRHKEKLTIKWIAFALIMLQLIFSILNHFFVEGTAGRPQRFVSAIPAMNYLFSLTLNLCYGGFVIYYVLQQRRFAFYHSHMRNMPLVALLSLTAVLIPVVFFVLDLSKPNISGWGSYVRWVGSAAASVVVWEWVERIEALERDEKKGGILGREIFDGDEMLDAKPGSNATWPSSTRKDGKSGKGNSGSTFGFSSGWSSVTAKARGFGRSRQSQRTASRSEPNSSVSRDLDNGVLPKDIETVDDACYPAVPPAVVSPINRQGDVRAKRTIHNYHDPPGNEARPRTQGTVASEPHIAHIQLHQLDQQTDPSMPQNEDTGSTWASRRQTIVEGLQRIPNPFRRPRETPPPEVARALAERCQEPGTSHNRKAEDPSVLERLRLKKAPKPTSIPRPVIVVPAPPRRRSSMVDDLDDPGRGNEIELSPEQTESMSEDDSADTSANRTSDTVLDAAHQSGSVSPLSQHEHRRSM